MTQTRVRTLIVVDSTERSDRESLAEQLARHYNFLHLGVDIAKMIRDKKDDAGIEAKRKQFENARGCIISGQNAASEFPDTLLNIYLLAPFIRGSRGLLPVHFNTNDYNVYFNLATLTKIQIFDEMLKACQRVLIDSTVAFLQAPTRARVETISS